MFLKVCSNIQFVLFLVFNFFYFSSALAKIQALLVFQRLPVCRQKPNVLECAAGFFLHGTQRACIYHVQ